MHVCKCLEDLRKVMQETNRGEVGTVWAWEGDLTFPVYFFVPIEYCSMYIIIKDNTILNNNNKCYQMLPVFLAET